MGIEVAGPNDVHRRLGDESFIWVVHVGAAEVDAGQAQAGRDQHDADQANPGKGRQARAKVELPSRGWAARRAP